MSAGTGLGAASLLGPDSTLWRLACVIASAVAVVALRLVEPADVARIRSAVRRRLGSPRGG